MDINTHRKERQIKITSYQCKPHSSRPLNNRGPCGCILDKDVEITTFYDENGNEVDPISCLIRGEDHYRKETHTVTVSEGDTFDYWMATAANAIKAIEKIMEITVNCEDKDAVWEGD